MLCHITWLILAKIDFLLKSTILYDIANAKIKKQTESGKTDSVRFIAQGRYQGEKGGAALETRQEKTQRQPQPQSQPHEGVKMEASVPFL